MTAEGIALLVTAIGFVLAALVWGVCAWLAGRAPKRERIERR